MATLDDIYNQSMYCSVKVYSSRNGVNVMPSVGSQYNWEFSPTPSGMSAADYVRECVASTVSELSNGRSELPTWDTLRSDSGWERGKYSFTVWMPKTNRK